MENEIKTSTVDEKYTYNDLPKIFKKSYVKNKIQKKLFNKIYIKEDLELVKSFFKDDAVYDGKMELEIPKDTNFTKRDFLRLKKISKEIKKQKFRFKVVPFIAVITLLILIFALVNFTKNLIVKKAIQNTAQSIFQAKCDIYKLNVSFLDTKLKIGNLQIADKKQPMLNLFDANNIIVDFNLVNLLRAKFDLENIECNDIKYHTQRTVSGEIPHKEFKIEDTQFVKEMKNRIEESLEKTKLGITDLFQEYTPENVMEKYKTNLKSPELAVKVKDTTLELVEKWKKEPENLKQLSQKYLDNSKKLIQTDINSLKNDKKLQAQTLLLFTDTLDEGKKLYDKIKQKTNQLKTDSNTVKQLFEEIETTLINDKNFAVEQINKITEFKIPDGKQLLGNTFDTAGYILMGKYYPYVEKVCGYANKGKEISGKISQRKTVKPKGISRDTGSYIYWKKDNIPIFLLRHALINGTGFNFEIDDLSSDMTRYGKPAAISGSIINNNITHQMKLNADFRKNTKESPFLLSYSVSNVPLLYDFKKIVETKGIPDINSKLNAQFTAEANEKAEFTLSGNMKLNDAVLKSETFEPEFANRIYQNALSQIHNIEAEVKAGYGLHSGIILDIDSNADKVLLNVIKSVISSELATIKELLITKIDNELAEKSKELNFDLGNFNSLTDKILNYETTVADFNTKLQEKIDEIKELTEEKAKQNTDAIKEKAKNKAVDIIMNGFVPKK